MAGWPTGRGKLLLQIAALAVVVALGITIAGIQWFSRDLPSMARLEMIEPALKTRVLAADSTIIKEFFIQDRILLELEEIPLEVQQAFIAIEDRRFYNHFGIDFVRLAAVVWKDLRHWNRREGASTITQQLSRDLFLTKEQTFPRKIKEALLALRIERTYSKDEILELYLNQIYFGAGTYGIEAASRKFFGRSVTELELHQTALIAGLNKNPEGYNPFVNPDRALRRRNIVLTAMEDFGLISEVELDSLKTRPLDVAQQETGSSGMAAYFTEHIRQILAAKYGSQSIYRDGFTVYTTLDPVLQRVAEDSLETYVQQIEREEKYELTRQSYLDSIATGNELAPNYLQSAVIALDPRNGHIKAMVGGRSFEESEFNCAIQANRQPGSAFKLFIYVAALENGYGPSDILLDTPIVVELPHGEVYKPRNFSEKFSGAVSLRHALNESINVPAIKLLQKIGAPSIIGTARRMGIKSPLRPYLSLALGAQEVNLLELTSAFGVLATGGIRAEPMAILKIEDRNGNTLEEYREYQEEVLSPEISYVITDMLKTVVDEGTGKTVRMMGLNIPLAGKTGTTDDYTDGWFIGFSPELAVGVWTGFNEKIPIGRNRTGARVALPIWVDVMRAAYPSGYGPDFPRPERITEAMICEESGLIATPYCKIVRREIFIEGMEPVRQCDLHKVSPYDMLDSDRDFRDMDKDALRDKELPQN